MTVTKIEAVTKNRYKVYVDEQFAFVLYKGELSRYHVAVGECISENVFHEIKNTVVLKRAKLRALHLLNDMGRTSKQLQQKLRQSDYTEDIIDKTMEYVSSFGYVNDEEYARNFILCRKDRKSQKELRMLLESKGISEKILEHVFEECYEHDAAKEAIAALLKKKKYNSENADYKETQKIYAYLMRKGFKYDDIRQVIQVSEWNA